MRILLLTQVVVYPAHSGPTMKTLQVLRYLAAHHEIVYCTFARDSDEATHAQRLSDLCVRIATVPLQRSRLLDLTFLAASIAHHDTFLLRRDERSAMLAMVRQLLHDEYIDLIYVDQLQMMRSVPNEWDGPVILDEHNAVWQVVERLAQSTRNLFTSWLLHREMRILQKQEAEACQRARQVLAVSEHDRLALQKIAGATVAIQVVPITIDVAQFTTFPRTPIRGRLLTIGTLYWPPNSEGLLWWLRDGYQQLRRLYPEAEHTIIGAQPPAALQRLARRLPGVHLYGYAANAVPFWREASLLAVPLLSGGGVRVKILEAMALGVPIVSTTIGCEGLAVEHGIHLLIADTPETFARACARVLEDEQLARTLVQNARQLVYEHYNAPIALQKLDTIIEQIAAADMTMANHKVS